MTTATSIWVLGNWLCAIGKLLETCKLIVNVVDLHFPPSDARRLPRTQMLVVPPLPCIMSMWHILYCCGFNSTSAYKFGCWTRLGIACLVQLAIVSHKQKIVNLSSIIFGGSSNIRCLNEMKVVVLYKTSHKPPCCVKYWTWNGVWILRTQCYLIVTCVVFFFFFPCPCLNCKPGHVRKLSLSVKKLEIWGSKVN